MKQFERKSMGSDQITLTMTRLDDGDWRGEMQIGAIKWTTCPCHRMQNVIEQMLNHLLTTCASHPILTNLILQLNNDVQDWMIEQLRPLVGREFYADRNNAQLKLTHFALGQWRCTFFIGQIRVCRNNNDPWDALSLVMEQCYQLGYGEKFETVAAHVMTELDEFEIKFYGEKPEISVGCSDEAEQRRAKECLKNGGFNIG